MAEESTGGNLGYNTELVASVANEVITKFKGVRTEVLEAFGAFVTSSNPEWYAKNAKVFFNGVADYVDGLTKDLYSTGESFLKSLKSAADAWKNMTGNKHDRIETDISDGWGATKAESKLSEYKTDLNNQVFMTATCEGNVGSYFETFAGKVKTAIDECATVLNKGELIGGGQSEAYVAMINSIASKYESSMIEQKAELTKALKESREKYEAQAKAVSDAKLEESES